MKNVNPTRISLKFNEKDPVQLEAVEILKKLGRKKSSFISKAIQYYMENCSAAIIQISADKLPCDITKLIDAMVDKKVQQVLAQLNVSSEHPQSLPAQNFPVAPVSSPVIPATPVVQTPVIPVKTTPLPTEYVSNTTTTSSYDDSSSVSQETSPDNSSEVYDISKDTDIDDISTILEGINALF